MRIRKRRRGERRRKMRKRVRRRYTECKALMVSIPLMTTISGDKGGEGEDTIHSVMELKGRSSGDPVSYLLFLCLGLCPHQLLATFASRHMLG